MLLANFPTQWVQSSPNLANLLGAGDTQLTLFQSVANAVKAAATLPASSGVDLESVCALVGLGRFPGESDAQYRLRVTSLMAGTTNAASNANMSLYLSGAVGGTVAVTDDPSQFGNFVVSILTYTGVLIPAFIKSEINILRSAGTGYKVYADYPTQRSSASMVSSFVVGDRTIGSFSVVRII